MPTRSTPLLLLLIAGTAAAQAPSPWQGEWGAFSSGHAPQGRRLSIHNCGNTTCKFSLNATSGSGYGGTAGDQELALQSPNSATATMPGETGKPPCLLRFERQASLKPAITVTATGETCTSYYGVGAASTMSGNYPLRSTTIYGGARQQECFLDNSPARLAIFTHPGVAALEQKWLDLCEGFPLQTPPKGESAYKHEEQMEAAILHSCDSAGSPANCLTTHYTADIVAMQSKKDAYLEGTVERGDPVEGRRLAQKIAGRYRYSSPNGDVQGDKYTTTDTLTIRPVGAASIQFDAELNFFNGHTCSLSGGALYRKDGSFVFDDAPANNASPDSPVCRLAIIPTAAGIKFSDITGGCKSYCGARGSLDGAQFTFKQRVPTSPVAKSGAPAKP